MKNLTELKGAIVLKKSAQKNINGGDAPKGEPWGTCPSGRRQCRAWGPCLLDRIPC